MRVLLLLPLLSLSLAACTGKPSPEQRLSAQSDLNQSGRPYAGPRGVIASFPPADSSFYPLRCHTEGPGEVCTRDSN